MARRIEPGIERGAVVTLSLDGVSVSAFAGETLATVLLAEGITAFNRSPSGAPRGPFCNMGTCFECQVKVAAPGTRDFRWRRACLCPVENGMLVASGARLPGPLIENEDGR